MTKSHVSRDEDLEYGYTSSSSEPCRCIQYEYLCEMVLANDDYDSSAEQSKQTCWSASQPKSLPAMFWAVKPFMLARGGVKAAANSSSLKILMLRLNTYKVGFEFLHIR